MISQHVCDQQCGVSSRPFAPSRRARQRTEPALCQPAAGRRRRGQGRLLGLGAVNVVFLPVARRTRSGALGRGKGSPLPRQACQQTELSALHVGVGLGLLGQRRHHGGQPTYWCVSSGARGAIGSAAGR
ncbi:hypothetical protein GQ53DRAFT_318213 [Thozetella sp. PMI_491]|nr:hypothetical protein GQ53DRAFT_318213 [Thozetella sp. PMI_491]